MTKQSSEATATLRDRPAKAISQEKLDEAVALLSNYDPNWNRAEDIVLAIAETISGLSYRLREET